MRSRVPRYSFVIPVYNEESSLCLLFPRLDSLLSRLDGAAEVIFVNDGSADSSAGILDAAAWKDPRFKVLHFSRNFGHQAAISAGMDAASGAAVIVMDADLQDPPEVSLQLIESWKAGFEVVYAQRVARDGETRFKRASAHFFYRMLGRLTEVSIPPDTGDFRLVDRKVIDVFRSMPERDRFVRGMFAWLGFRQTAVTFTRPPRAAGATKYSLRRMIRLALDGVIGFSDAPLRLALWLGALVSAGALAYGVYVMGLRLAGGPTITGWASLAVILCFLGGMNLLMTGVVGLYVGRIHSEVKGRPLYVVDRTQGFGEEASLRPAAAPRLAAVASAEFA